MKIYFSDYHTIEIELKLNNRRKLFQELTKILNIQFQFNLLRKYLIYRDIHMKINIQ